MPKDFSFAPRDYQAFLNLAEERAPRLYSAFLSLTWLREEAWTCPERKGYDIDVRKVQKLLNGLLGKEAVARLFQQRDEALADEEFCAEITRALQRAVEGCPIYS